jgi:hypothetical protein
MAVDNGAVTDTAWLVAATSIATILATGLVTIWTKHIDAKQKLAEHKLTIRASYVDKKVEAGKSFIATNNVGYHSAFLLKDVFINYRSSGMLNEELWKVSSEFARKTIDNALQLNDYSDAFFDLVKIVDEVSVASQDFSRKFLMLRVDSENRVSKEEFPSHVDSIIVIVDKIIECRLAANKLVRDELAKYDII